jgi:hypothetical protein
MYSEEEPCLFCKGTGQIVSSTTISGFKTCDCINIPQEEPKQKTLEKILPKNSNGKYSRNEIEKAFELGAKWQAKRMYSDEPKPTIKQVDYVAKKQEIMYSEEEVIELLTERCKHFGTSLSPFNKLLLKQDLEWFEQNKKK